MPRPCLILYRYQILPISREVQLTLGQPSRSIEELLASKNLLFEEAFRQVTDFSTSKATVTHKSLIDTNEVHLLRLAVNRYLDRETKDFQHEPVETWPSFIVFVWNAPDKQIIAIEQRYDAFQLPETVMRTIADRVNEKLTRENLRMHWEPIFEQRVFWNLAEKYEGRIHEVSFQLVTPNMSNISASLSEDIKNFAKRTNTAETTIALSSDPSGALSLPKGDTELRGLVDYAAKGGGDIRIRIKGIKKSIHTSKSKKTIQIDEIEVRDPVAAVNLLKTLLDQ